jgi:hypothetical protein
MTLSPAAYALIRPLLFRLDAEKAHGLALNVLRNGGTTRPPVSDPALASNVAGLAFPNPVGMAAGFDKDGEVPDALLGLGFGFAEVGSITPCPSPATRNRACSAWWKTAPSSTAWASTMAARRPLTRASPNVAIAAAFWASTSAPTRMPPIASPIMPRGRRCSPRWPPIWR